MIERSFLGVEKMIIWLGKRAMSGDQYTRAESFRTVVGSTLLRVCCQSPVVFQVIRLVFAIYFSQGFFPFESFKNLAKHVLCSFVQIENM